MTPVPLTKEAIMLTIDQINGLSTEEILALNSSLSNKLAKRILIRMAVGVAASIATIVIVAKLTSTDDEN